MQPLKEESPQEFDDKLDKLVGRISFWVSFLLATICMVVWFQENPPDTPEVQKMRLFFKENAIEIGEFLRIPPEKIKEEAAKKKHPFYLSYVKASQVEKGKIKALYHNSVDYTPNQYWVYMVGGWLILFTTFWFVGLMIQGVVNLVRNNSNVT